MSYEKPPVASTRALGTRAHRIGGRGSNPAVLIQSRIKAPPHRLTPRIDVWIPLSPLGQYMEAALWPQVRRPEARAVISHVSALALHELLEVGPAKIHIILSPDLRLRRTVPPQLVLHFALLAPDDVQVVEGVPVTTPARTIRDVHAAHLGPALVRRAIAAGRRTGRLTHDEADRLTRELLAESTPRKESVGDTEAEIDTASRKTRRQRGKTPARRRARDR